MNQHSSTDSSVSSPTEVSAEAISRRAYEIWEREGKPEGCDLRHWLQAEQELGVSRSENGQRSSAMSADRPAVASPSRNQTTDTKPLPSARGGPVQREGTASAARDPKRVTTTPFSGEKNGSGSVAGQNAAKRKPSAAPVL